MCFCRILLLCQLCFLTLFNFYSKQKLWHLTSSCDVGTSRSFIALIILEISKGDILFENNNLLCYATTNIYWPDILANGTLQHVRVSNDIISSMKPCMYEFLSMLGVSATANGAFKLKFWTGILGHNLIRYI